ncbi:GntR family transcriptional regulator [Corynebacterium dentalis]|uniref:GntR family transcriptional regulator n=1 Tax=Corynebacterium dentalis TaxID=2014528 RepID=UPI0028A0E22C|nr:GntR family transcriptional regulator [Corynebacterium dentalis]
MTSADNVLPLPTGPASGSPTDATKTAAQSQPERIRGMIRRQIIRAELRPGQIFTEPDLAREYGVSKTPVREALQMLTVEGLVNVLPRKGYMVRSLSFHDVREVMDLRLILEPPLAAAAARNVTADLVTDLRSLVEDQFRDGNTLEDRLAAARDFHVTCSQASRNTRAAAVDRSLTDEVMRFYHLMPTARDHFASTEEQAAHEAIFDAVATGNAEAAQEIMHDHLLESNAAMIRTFYNAGPL